ncbi:MAG: zinc ribbon domain-containing protein [Clostridia bacterium]|nr:zinc ribbon domain-containing protein [Clostridia bacterium]
MKCFNCGAELAQNEQFCPYCGQSTAQSAQQEYYQQQPVYNQQQYYSDPSQGGYYSSPAAQPMYPDPAQYPANCPPQFKPLSPWGYLGYSILFMLGPIGLIICIVFAFDNDNINRRNFARSRLYAILVALGLAAVIGLLALLLGVSIFGLLEGF